MTKDNQIANATAEVIRGRQCLLAAKKLLELGLFADSVSRAYYGAFHMIRALLLSVGLEPKTHAGALHMFNQEFIAKGTLPSSLNRLVAGLQRMRELADYDAQIVFSAPDAAAELADAEALSAAISTALIAHGVTVD